MVFFTCNHCGESLKKPAVEKHYQWKSCRGAVPYLTCVDCLKDFNGDEFKEHTKCISEEEKYSAKGFVAKPNKNKGAQKQESWTETLQNSINKPGLDPNIKRIIEKIAGQTNVPRKKPKFINFVKNSLKISLDNANKVWDVVEEALSEFNKIAEAKNKEKKELEKKAKEATSMEIGNTEADPDDGKKMKKKKKKNQEVKEEIDSVNDKNGYTEENVKSRKRPLESTNNGTEEATGKKNKKKNNSNGANGIANENSNSEEQENSNGMEISNSFNWQTTILKILTKKSEPMAIQKLKNKVMKQYVDHTSIEVNAKIEKKFLKKLKTTPNVAITDELVKLVK